MKFSSENIVSNYHPDWQNNRLKYIISIYGINYFDGKSILDMGSFNGFFGANFKNMGAKVHLVEGRQENVNNIKFKYSNISIEQYNLDTPDWKFGIYDIIINFGLYYHLQNYHKEFLINCIQHCDLMFFETEIYDTLNSEIYFKEECGMDQSLTNIGGIPSTKYIEDIFKSQNINFKKIEDGNLNGNGHIYDWKDTFENVYISAKRRFWIISKRKE